MSMWQVENSNISRTASAVSMRLGSPDPRHLLLRALTPIGGDPLLLVPALSAGA